MTDHLTPLPYATPYAPARPIWPAALLVFLSLGLIGLAGCFMIGVGAALDLVGFPPSNPPVWTTGHYAYVGVLYLLTAVCFVGGLVVAVYAVRAIKPYFQP